MRSSATSCVWPDLYGSAVFRNWRQVVVRHANQMLGVIFKTKAWLELLRLSYPDVDDTLRYLQLIKDAVARLKLLDSQGFAFLDRVRKEGDEQRKALQKEIEKVSGRA